MGRVPQPRGGQRPRLVGRVRVAQQPRLAVARRRASYETWYWIHVYGYLAVALAFLHQLFVGADFTHDQLAAIYWISLYALTAALVIVFRFGQPFMLNRRHRLRVAAVTAEGPGVVSVDAAA